MECFSLSVCWLALDICLLWIVYLSQSVDCRWGFLVMYCLPFSVCWLTLGVYLLRSVYLLQSVECRWGFTWYGVFTFIQSVDSHWLFLLVTECFPFSVCWLPLGVYLLWSVYHFQSVDCHWAFTCYMYGVFTIFSLLTATGCFYLLRSVFLFPSVDCRWGFT